MDLSTRATLARIGFELDRGARLVVKNGGIVALSNSAILSTLGEEKFDVSERSRGRESAPGTPWARPGSTWSQGRGSWSQARGSWTACPAAPLLGSAVNTYREEDLKTVYRAYTGTKTWQDEEGMWLLTESTVLPGLRQAAVFLTAISYSQQSAKGWGFWASSITPASWIGPRHTNFPDGSICAFFAEDGTWMVGEPLTDLIDLYTVWALRHVHLQVIGWWPGEQAPCHPYERLLECTETEYCGCGSGLRYGRCCRGRDLARDRIADAVNFALSTGGCVRRPPRAVMDFVSGHRSHPPARSGLFPQEIPGRQWFGLG